MSNNIKRPEAQLRTSQKLLRKFGIGCLLLVSGTTIAGADNYATQLELKNCGAYGIDKIKLQRKRDDSSWETVRNYNIYDIYGEDLKNGHSYCVDISQVYSEGLPVFAPGDQARFRTEIDLGNTVNCDGTNYGTTSDGKNRRLMKMKGTTLNNNGCRTVGYESTRSSSSCSGYGDLLDNQSC